MSSQKKKVIHKNSYHFQNVEQNKKEEGNPKYPIFSGGDGTFYYSDYTEADPSSSLLLQLLSHNSLPKPTDPSYNSFQDYEKALKIWESKVLSSLSSLTLPFIVGRCFSRPTLVDSMKDEREEASTTSASSQKTNDEFSDSSERSRATHTESEETSSISISTDTRGSESSDSLLSSRLLSPPALASRFVQGQKPSLWESYLVPPEPDPMLYDTFTDYETAMRGWAKAVTSTVGFIPPHASKLQELIPIKVADVVLRYEFTKFVPDNLENAKPQRLPGLTKEIFFEKIVRALPKINPNTKITFNQRVKQDGSSIVTIKSIQSFLEEIITRASIHLIGNGKNNFYLYDCGGELHTSLLRITNIGTMAVFATIEGITGNYIGRQPGQIGPKPFKNKLGAQVKSVPVFDFEEMNYKNLFEKENYLKEMGEKYIELIYRYRNHSAFAWYNPDKVTPQKLKEETQELGEFFSSSRLSHDKVLELLKLHTHVDVFYDKSLTWKCEGGTGPFESVTDTGLSALAKSVDYSRLSDIFELVLNTRDELVHSKVSSLVRIMLPSSVLAPQLLKNIYNLDLKYISLLPYLIYYFEPVERDVLPYKYENMALLSQVLPSEEWEIFFKLVFKWYCNYELFTEVRKSQKYTEANNLVTQQNKHFIAEIVKFLEGKTFDLSNIVLKGVGHRSSKVSGLFLFFLIKLLKINEVSSIILQPNYKLLPQIYQLSISKMRHVRAATQRLLAFFKDNHKKELVNFLLERNYFITIVWEGKSHVFADFILSFLDKELKTDFQWIDIGRIQDLFRRVVNANIEHLSHNYHFRLLARFAEVFSKEKGNLSNQTYIEGDFLELTRLAVKLSRSSGIQSNTGGDAFSLTTLGNTLVSIRHFLTIDDFYHTALENEEFIQTITSLSTHPNPFVNSESWKSLYQILSCHEGAMKHLLENKILKNFLVGLNVGSGLLVMENGLKTITKILDMPPRIRKGKEDKKSVESDLKLFCTFIAQNFLINLHMITINLSKSFPGGGYHALAKFYNRLLSVTQCKTILKEYMRNGQYKADVGEMAKSMTLSLDKVPSKKNKRDTWV